MDMEKCIEIQNLQKSFGAIHAVNNLSLQVETGQLFAFLGVNGAGKSTTISMICGQLRQDAGQIYVNGRNTLKNMNAIKQDIGRGVSELRPGQTAFCAGQLEKPCGAVRHHREGISKASV